MKTYVYEGTEVKKTGRTATKQTKQVGASQAPKIFTLVEITPVADFDWKKWVAEEQLFNVNEAPGLDSDEIIK